MSLTAGVRFGQYEIVSALGAGGMGEVYRARDTSLGRDVALKLLPAEVVNDPDRLVRFELEARAASGLNHPAILAIYELGRVESQAFISMELVEGMTLRELLAAGPVPPRRALQIAAPLADGLAKAHETGIVHRDLKPENLMVSHDGFAKILDFGLAKLTPVSSHASAAVSTAPTIAGHGTQPGITLGTVGYMSPEQASGGVADYRSDQFSLGLVLYELLTGRHAFSRATAVETLSAIIRDDPPPIHEINPGVPVPVQWIIERCLAKPPGERYGSTRDLARDLATARDHFSELAKSGAAPVSAAPAVRIGRREQVAWALVAALVIAGLALLRRPETPAPAPDPVVRFTLAPPKDVSFAWGIGSTPFAVSPDGRQLAFTGMGADKRRRIWLHSFDSLESRAVPGTEGAWGAFWSPDGSALGFFTADRLKRVPVSGGDALVICEAQFGGGATWNREGGILFAPGTDTALYRVPATGGTPIPVTTLDAARGDGAHMWPVFLPDGRHFVFTIMGGERAGTYVSSLDGADHRRLLPTTAAIGFSEPDLLFFMRERILLAQRLDMERFELVGEPLRVADNVGTLGPSAAFAVSANGTVVHWPGSRIITQPTWFRRDGTTDGTLGPPAAYMNVAISPDGSQVAIDRFDQTPGIWLLDRARGTATRATFGELYESTPVWSPDAAAFVFAAARDTAPNLYLKRIGVAGDEERLFRSTLQMFPQSWSADGRFIAYVTISPKTRRDIWLVNMTGERTPTPFIETPFIEDSPRISPDGRWLAYASNDAGTQNVYVTRFPQPGGKWSVSPEGGSLPVWRRDGRELYYREPGGMLMAVPVSANPDFTPGAAVPLFNPRGSVSGLGLGTYYDVAPDGRFLVNVFVEEISSPATVVLKWRADPAAAAR